MDDEKGIRVVFSCLFAERVDYLPIVIDNFLANTESTCVLIVNMANYDDYNENICTPSSRVIIYAGEIRRAKVGHTLLAGHLETYGYADAHYENFEYFVPIASNSLFVRKFDHKAAIRKLKSVRHKSNIYLSDLPNDWVWWPVLGKSKRVIDFLMNIWGFNTAQNSQIEGLLSSRGNWGTLYAARSEIMQLGAMLLEEDAVLPVEEMLPTTFFIHRGNGEFVHICHNFWDRGPDRPVQYSDIIEMERFLGREICIMKWVNRDPNDQLACSLSKPWIPPLLDGLGSCNDSGDVSRIIDNGSILRGVATSLEQVLGFRAIDIFTASETRHLERQQTHKRPVRGRDIVAFADAQADTASTFGSYVYMEDNINEALLSVRILRNSGCKVSVYLDYAEVDDRHIADAIPTQILGYFYIKIPGEHPSEGLSKLSIDAGDLTLETANELVLRDGDHYRKTTRCRVTWPATDSSFFCSLPAPPQSPGRWIGIPLFANNEVIFSAQISDINWRDRRTVD